MTEPSHPHGEPWNPQARPTAPPTPSDSSLLRNRMLLVAAGVVGVGAVLHLCMFALSTILGSAGVVLLMLTLATAGGYYWYRTQRTADARALEVQMSQVARTAASSLTTHAQTMWNTGNLAPARPRQPPPDQPATPFLQETPTVRTATSTDGGVVSALLLLPSLVVYAILWNADFNSPWQPWWLVAGLNVWFVFCVGARCVSGNRKAPAVLLAIAGTVLAGMASSPSDDWSLTALLTTDRVAMSGGYAYTYSEPPYELLPWIHRLPVLVAVLFVIAWSIARRSQPGWALGLIPAGLLAWWSVWYSEQGMTTTPNWFTFWLLTVGVFVGGCLACLVADNLTRPRSHPVLHTSPAPPRSY